jgi:D-tyrosyl-tRNA(Tyr) deacylase
MRVIVQRSLDSNVTIDNKIVGQIDKGLVVLVGFTQGDSSKDIDYLVDKIVHLRIFDDENGVMNKSLLDVKGDILSISQFTLYANPYEGRRPSYVASLNQELAKPLYEEFNQKLIKQGVKVATGVFRANMVVNIKNDGPTTIMIESRR